ncbi:hypothetical protein AAE250_16355 [Bacteroides sp. GD17]|jgi:hypothetical protein|uniref:hypothetical protein n=1 Tax=Bacteroides sp. GD17 TaxID=3139826 RepID=UPI00204BC0B1|nr:hypothetical protein [uncultured Bacteroides sp.]DAV67204.1 MAG TPA: hypothetical protein [Caudoviricetes sp.]
MPLISQPQDVPVHIDPYSFLAEIQVLSGNPVQNYNKDTGKYEPDRNLIPCVLMPYISAQDPEGIMSGSQVITGAEWYEGSPKADGSNRIISATSGYVISDSGTPTYSLKVKKNIDYNTPLELHCLFTFTDKRKNTQETVERSIVLKTTLFDSLNYSLKLDKPKGWTINPLDVVPASGGAWLYSITAQLYTGEDPVADANAAYWWEVFENGVWRNFTDDEINIFVNGRNSNGTWGKKITVDARMFRRLTVRARAAWYSGTRPSVPSSAELMATTAVKVEMPRTLRVDVRQTKGIKLTARMNTTVGFEAQLKYNNNLISNSKNDLFKIEWYCKSSKPGSSAVLVGTGRTVEFQPKTYNFDPLYSLGIYTKVYMYAVTALVMSGTKAITSGSKYLITSKYE